MHLKHGQKVVLAVVAVLFVLYYLSKGRVVPWEGMENRVGAGGGGGAAAAAAVLGAPGVVPSDGAAAAAWGGTNPVAIATPTTAGPNFLSAGSHVGVNSVGQSKRNSSYDLRSTPANPKIAVSPWMNSTIEPGSGIVNGIE